MEIEVGSLYAGIGGICKGFESAGCKLKWANEFDKNACITYRANFNHELIEGDVLSLNVKNIPKVAVLTAGFPCQPFSVAGYRKGFEDERGNHFFKILEFVDEMRPKVIFLENVKNLHGHDKGNTFKVIKQEIEKREYTFDAKILNTKDFGNIPHNRERLFMICFDKKIVDEEFEFEWPENEILESKITDLLETEKVDEKYFYREDKYMFDMLKESMVSKETVYQFRRHYVRENKSNVCPTLTANMGTGGHNVPLVSTNHGYRKLTPRECLRFQGFKEDFVIPKIAVSQLYKQAGNSVSVPVIERLAKNIVRHINHNTLQA